MKTSNKAAVVANLILLLGIGCGEKKTTRAEADELLARISRLDPNAPASERERRLGELAAVEVKQPELRALRDTCHSAHAGLLQAEGMQAEVRSALDALEAAQAAGQPPAPDALGTLEVKMRDASAALTRARASQERCEDDARELTLQRR